MTVLQSAAAGRATSVHGRAPAAVAQARVPEGEDDAVPRSERKRVIAVSQ